MEVGEDQTLLEKVPFKLIEVLREEHELSLPQVS